MRVASYLKSEILGTNLHDLDFESYSTGELQESKDFLVYGFQILEKGKLQPKGIDTMKLKYLNVTMPTEYAQSGFIHDQRLVFDEIYGICKYS